MRSQMTVSGMGKKLRILVVDDDDGMAETLVDILEDAGLTVETASDGFQAVEMVQENGFDLALMDIRMPGMNGVEAFKRIKNVDPAMRVAMMTAFTQEALIQEAYDEGAREVFFKPLQLERVMDFIQGGIAA